ETAVAVADIGQAAVVPEIRRPKSGLSAESLSKTFSLLDYDLELLRGGGVHVPRLFLTDLPADLSKIAIPADRKTLFFKTVLPIILRVNDEIKSDRARLLKLRVDGAKGGLPPAADRLWLAAMAEKYRVKRGDLGELARRVDLIPPSLALAQAAEESGWGTSRFAVEGNALFGQWTFTPGSGLKPRRRDAGKSYRIRAFDTLLDAVRAYTLNLNTHRAYRVFRQRRLEMRRDDRAVDGMALAETLTSYSQRGKKYVRSIRTIIDVNRLGALDNVRLDNVRLETPPPKRRRI
ncbi:MAG: glucosaminidase domain-containing protein, partial [Proteobacteria bacterium]|nr:glucosaminidase domain-containing protein [Pseudomonadota bacterium]